MTNEVLKAIYDRRSVKKYTDKPVPAEILDEILKAGSWAANGKAWQAPVMVAVTDPETRETHQGSPLCTELHSKVHKSMAASRGCVHVPTGSRRMN